MKKDEKRVIRKDSPFSIFMPNLKQKNKKSITKSATFVLAFVSVFSMGLFAKTALASEITPDIVINLVNDARTKDSESILNENIQLTKAAEAKAQDMIENNYFAHISPQGKSPWFWIDKSGYDYRFAGENLAINFVDAEQQQEAWMKSPSHRENILNQKYQEIGVAVRTGKINGHESTITVQVFGTSMNAIAAPLPAKNQGSVAAAESSKPEVSILGNKFDMKGAVDGNFKFMTIQNQYQTAAGLWMLAAIVVAFVSVDVAVVIHRKHIKPILVQQALHGKRV